MNSLNFIIRFTRNKVNDLQFLAMAFLLELQVSPNKQLLIYIETAKLHPFSRFKPSPLLPAASLALLSLLWDVYPSGQRGQR